MKTHLSRAFRKLWFSVRNTSWAFPGAMSLLLVSQIILYQPGSDVSPYAYATGALEPNQIAGISVQSFALGVLALVCLVGIFRNARNLPSHTGLIIALLATIALIAAFTTDTLLTYLQGMGKLALPVLIFLYLITRDSSPNFTWRLFAFINIFCLAQVGLSLVFFGTPGANTYYHELGTEYFGLFHHPFAFAGVLGLCAIVAIFRLGQGRNSLLCILLVVLNSWFIMQTQVRTFLLAYAVSAAIAVFIVLLRRRHFIWIISLSALGATSLILITFFGLSNDRVTEDVSSGRFERWGANLGAWSSDSSLLHIIFGGGAEHIYSVNEEIFGVRINSLNVFIDYLTDYGVVGLLAFVALWFIVLKCAAHLGDRGTVFSLTIFVGLGAIISNTFEFPIIMVVFAIGLTSFSNKESRKNNEDTLIVSAPVS